MEKSHPPPKGELVFIGEETPLLNPTQVRTTLPDILQGPKRNPNSRRRLIISVAAFGIALIVGLIITLTVLFVEQGDIGDEGTITPPDIIQPPPTDLIPSYINRITIQNIMNHAQKLQTIATQYGSRSIDTGYRIITFAYQQRRKFCSFSSLLRHLSSNVL